jgi:hypothetical protein
MSRDGGVASAAANSHMRAPLPDFLATKPTEQAKQLLATHAGRPVVFLFEQGTTGLSSGLDRCGGDEDRRSFTISILPDRLPPVVRNESVERS